MNGWAIFAIAVVSFVTLWIIVAIGIIIGLLHALEKGEE